MTGWVEWDAIRGDRIPLPPMTRVAVRFPDGEEIICTVQDIIWDFGFESAAAVAAYKVLENV